MRYFSLMACLFVSLATQAQNSVTFQVDMAGYTGGSYGTVNLNGNFNGWCGPCTPMSDDNGDGVYDVTVDLPDGAIEYKFTVDAWANQEGFTEGSPCTITTDGFTNRSYEVSGDATLEVVCWSTCQACQGATDVTFNVNMANETVSSEGVFLAGGGTFGNPGDNPMTDDDGDGIYSITVSLPIGLTSYYAFTNGACGDWSCKENLTGLPCGDPANFNDRSLTVDGAMSINTCFGECSTDGSCSAPPTVFHDVTFNVNMENETLSAEGLFLAGGVDFGFPGDFPMTDDDGDDVYSITVTVADGYTGDYTFVNGPDWPFKEDISGQDCAVPPFDDRRLTNIIEDTVINTCFGLCSTDGTCGTPPDPIETVPVTFQVNMASYDGTYGSVNLNGSFAGWCGACIAMDDADGDGIYSVEVDMPLDTVEYKFTVDGWTDQENLTEGESCTSTIDGFTNRSLIVTGAQTLDVVCWNSCENACGDNGGGDNDNLVNLTFNVNAENIAVGPNGIYLGGGVFGDAQAHAMSDADGDGTWSVTLAVESGLTGNYIFLNSPNDGGDWGAKENLAGLECSDPANFDDRILAPVTEDAVISTCFGQCSTDGTCEAPSVTYDVTFRVDMAGYEGAYGTVNLNGSFAGWCGGCIEMLDNDGDGVYEISVALAEDTVEYKFTVDGWTDQEQFEGGESCTSTIDGFTNRTLIVAGEAILDVVCWNSCDACASGIAGCTNPEFLQYDPYATEDDGSCATVTVPGCIYDAAVNYNPLANVDDNSCEFEEATNDCPADLDQDGSITTADLLAFLAMFGQQC